MLELFCPDLYLNSIFELTPDILLRRNIKGLIMDLDNTLVAWNEQKVDETLQSWFAVLKKNNISICIVSNNSKDRVTSFADIIGIPAVPKAVKPRKKAFLKGIKIIGTDIKETAVVGDQIFTDIFGGNRLGLFTILVMPISSKEFIWTRFMRCLEKKVLKHLVKKGCLKMP